MDTSLDKEQMKFVHVAKIVVLVFSLCSLIIGIWLFIMAKDFKDQSIMFPLILGFCCLYNVYRFNKTIKINRETINSFHIKCHLLMLGRAALISLTYLFVVIHDTRQAIGMAIVTLFVIGVEILVRRMEAKKIKNYE